MTPPAGCWRRRWRTLALGLPTLLGVSRRGWFIPHRHAAAGLPAGQRPAYAAVEAVFEQRRRVMARVLQVVGRYSDPLSAIADAGDAGSTAPRWSQDWFPRLDAAVAYAAVRRLRPRLLVEVGAGHSTRFFARAAADGGLSTRIVAIDPNPRADLTAAGVTIMPLAVQRAGPAPFAALRGGDILSIDSSHILMPGSDVDMLLNRVLPSLPAGVLVHVHDVFLPDDYPASWAWRGYNEQLAVAVLVLGGGWRVLWSSRYVTTRLSGLFAASPLSLLPLAAGAVESSLWLLKTGDSRGTLGAAAQE